MPQGRLTFVLVSIWPAWRATRPGWRCLRRPARAADLDGRMKRSCHPRAVRARWGTVAINAPLTRPRGRCCLDDDCPCRHDPGTRAGNWSGTSGIWASPYGAPPSSRCSPGGGARLAAALRCAGGEPMEVYPYATFRLLGLPTDGKRRGRAGGMIHDALQPLVARAHPPEGLGASARRGRLRHTANLWREGRTRTVGVPDEGLMVIPDAP